MEARGPEALFYGEGWRGFRTARYKYTLRGAAEGVPWQFFDLTADPFERSNLIETQQYQEEIAKHHRYLITRMRETGDTFVVLPAFGCEGLHFFESQDAGDVCLKIENEPTILPTKGVSRL